MGSLERSGPMNGRKPTLRLAMLTSPAAAPDSDACLDDATTMATPCPFQVGQRFRVRHDYSFLNHVFRAGEEVVFNDCAYDAKAGVTRYWFRRVESGDTTVWHFFDDQTPEAVLHDMFQPLTAA